MTIEANFKATESHLQNMARGDVNYYHRGLELAEAGRHQEALGYIQEHLRTKPDDPQALNDAGAVLHCLGRSQEAIEHFIKAKSLQNNSPEIIWNLSEAYLALGRANEATPLFDDMERMGTLNPDVLNRAARSLLDQNDKGGAIKLLLRSLKISPDQEILKPMIKVIQSKRPKIAFFFGTSGMISHNEVCEFITQRFETNCLQERQHDLYELMKWCDICWFEQCNDIISEVSRLPKVCKIIVRLDHLEYSDNWLKQVQWQNIDIIITVGKAFVKTTLLEKVPDIQDHTRIVTIPAGIDLEKFKFADKHRGKNIAFVGNLDMRKNPMFLLQCMQKLHYLDPEYKLFFAGSCQNTILGQYIRHMVDTLKLTDVVIFDGWNNDINSWLQDKHYIVSCGITEGQNMGLLEGMACGLKPVIHHFPGASGIFPQEFLFNISEEFCRQVLSDTYEPQRYRKFVEENYPLKNQLNKINDLFIQLEAQIDSQKAGPAFSAPKLHFAADSETRWPRKENPANDNFPGQFSGPMFPGNRLQNF